jgi:transposase
MKPTPTLSTEPQLPATVEACHAVIRETWGMLHQLIQRVQVLEEQVKLNSRASSKPPSSDGPGRGSRLSKPKSGRSVGAQPGHKGSFRAMLPGDEVDQQVLCRPAPQCQQCRGEVVIDEVKPIRHEVFDLPPIQPQVTEYLRLRGVYSSCGLKYHGALPAGVPSGQLDPRALALALVGTLSGQFHLTQGNIQRLLAKILSLKFSIGTISMAHGHVAQALAEPVRQLHAHLNLTPVRHADETSHKSHNHMMWAWTQTCDWGAHFRIDPSRGQEAAKALLGAQPQGVIVSDRYASYNFIDLQQRQVCWAHLLRDFARIATRQGQTGVIGARLQACGYAPFRWRKQGRPAGHFEWLQRCIQKHLQASAAQTVCTRTANTCANLLKVEVALWHFLRNPAAPPTNNAAERALRGFVIKRKLSFFTRSGRGLRFFERIFSTVQTCAIQGRQTFGYLQEVMSSWLAGKTAPSLVPDHVLARQACV